MAVARRRRTVADVPSNASAASLPVLVACDGRSPSAPRLADPVCPVLVVPGGTERVLNAPLGVALASTA